jgi:hypothetical protein
MQLNCSKCSQPISLTDNIESYDGHLSHADCKRPQVLSPEERALVFVYCANHPVAYCLPCNEKYRFTELAADMLGSGRTNVCPRCRRDLTEEVRAHLFRCMMLPAEVRLRAQAVREAAQRLVKQSRQARDRADVLIREAEARLFEQQRALRTALARRKTN